MEYPQVELFALLVSILVSLTLANFSEHCAVQKWYSKSGYGYVTRNGYPPRDENGKPYNSGDPRSG